MTAVADTNPRPNGVADYPAIIVYPALFVLVGISLTIIGVIEHYIPGSYPWIVSFAMITGMFLIGRSIAKVIEETNPEDIAAAVAPKAAALASSLEQAPEERRAAKAAAREEYTRVDNEGNAIPKKGESDIFGNSVTNPLPNKE